jgi:hypothetical protein
MSDTPNLREAAAQTWAGVTTFVDGEPFLIIGHEGDDFILENEAGRIIRKDVFDSLEDGTDSDRLISVSRLDPFRKGSSYRGIEIGALAFDDDGWKVLSSDGRGVLPIDQMVDSLEESGWKISAADQTLLWLLQDDGDLIYSPRNETVQNHYDVIASVYGETADASLFDLSTDHSIYVAQGELRGGEIHIDKLLPLEAKKTASAADLVRVARDARRGFADLNIDVPKTFTTGDGERRAMFWTADSSIKTSFLRTFFTTDDGEEVQIHQTEYDNGIYVVEDDHGNEYEVHDDGSVFDYEGDKVGETPLPPEDPELHGYDPDRKEDIAPSYDDDRESKVATASKDTIIGGPSLFHGMTFEGMRAEGIEDESVSVTFPDGHSLLVPPVQGDRDSGRAIMALNVRLRDTIGPEFGGADQVPINVTARDEETLHKAIDTIHRFAAPRTATQDSDYVDPRGPLRCPRCHSNTVRATELHSDSKSDFHCLTCGNNFKWKVMVGKWEREGTEWGGEAELRGSGPDFDDPTLGIDLARFQSFVASATDEELMELLNEQKLNLAAEKIIRQELAVRYLRQGSTRKEASGDDLAFTGDDLYEAYGDNGPDEDDVDAMYHMWDKGMTERVNQLKRDLQYAESDEEREHIYAEIGRLSVGLEKQPPHRSSLEKLAPGREHMKGVSPKRNRQYEHVLESCKKEHPDYSLDRCKELAARTVNKYREEHGETKDSGWQRDAAAPWLDRDYFSDDPDSTFNARPEKACPTCGTPESAVRFNGDGTFSCPGCNQTLPVRSLSLRHSKSSAFADSSGTPLEVGRSYRMHSPKYKVPDVIDVQEITDAGITAAIRSGEKAGEFPLHISSDDIDTNSYSFEPFVSVHKLRNTVTGSTILVQADDQGDLVAWAREEDPDYWITSDLDQIEALVAEGRYELPERRTISKTAKSTLSAKEQKDLIDENPDGLARNFQKLQLQGTHYNVKGASDADNLLWLW